MVFSDERIVLKFFISYENFYGVWYGFFEIMGFYWLLVRFFNCQMVNCLVNMYEILKMYFFVK